MKEKTIYDIALEVIKEGTELLEDENQIKYFKSVVESLEYAEGMVEDNLEKETRLRDAAVKFANQLMFILFRKDNIGEELLAKFRTLPTPEETGKDVAEYEAEYRNRVDAINEKQKALMDERKALDIFLAVISGMTKEEAEQRMAQYEAQIEQATKQ